MRPREIQIAIVFNVLLFNALPLYIINNYFKPE